MNFVQGAAEGGQQKEFDHFFRFRNSFGHPLVTFSDASVTFSSLFCQTPFAGLLLQQGDSYSLHSMRNFKHA